jgi:hypothetical protein
MENENQNYKELFIYMVLFLISILLVMVFR